MITVFMHITLACYALALLKFMLYLFFRQGLIFKFAITFTILGIAANTTILFLRSSMTGHGPYFTTFEYLVFFSWLMAITFLIVEFKHKITDLGSFILPIIVVVFSLSYFAVDVGSDMVVPELWKTLHRTLSFIGYAHFAILFTVSIMYLLQEYQLKRKNFGALYHRLPSLEILDAVNHKALVLGFTLYTLGFVTGTVSNSNATGDDLFSWNILNILPLIAIWWIFCGLFVSRIMFGFRRGPFAKWSIAASIAVIIALFQHIKLY
ncbi:MAG: cytochrome c biogenesis protein CcsA [Nitrospinae bacterium]|nr:cytochrome c biogenesis protein CcsA [Nitrospinota bacterium]